MDKQIITFSANEQNLVRIGGEYHYSSNKVSYIGAHFDLGANWGGFDSVRAVWFTDRINGISTVLDGEGNCTVPTEALKKKDRVFVNLVGSIVSNGELTDRLTTYPAVALVVDSKAKVDSTETAPVTPSQFEQFVSIVQDAVANIKDIVSTTLNADYTLTFVYSDGTSYTTPSIRGERGPQGADGADGTDGNGIASAVLNSNYTLTLTFTDGTSYTTPSIRGAQGPKGDPGDVSQAQLDAAVSDLKSALMLEGRIIGTSETHFYSSAFINGGLNNGNIMPQTNYRVVSEEKIQIPYDIIITPSSTYRVGVHTYSADGSFIADSGWITSAYTIPANTIFRILIAKRSENTSVVADIPTFVNNVVVQSSLNKSIEESIDNIPNQYGLRTNIGTHSSTITSKTNEDNVVRYPRLYRAKDVTIKTGSTQYEGIEFYIYKPIIGALLKVSASRSVGNNWLLRIGFFDNNNTVIGSQVTTTDSSLVLEVPSNTSYAIITIAGCWGTALGEDTSVTFSNIYIGYEDISFLRGEIEGTGSNEYYGERIVLTNDYQKKNKCTINTWLNVENDSTHNYHLNQSMTIFNDLVFLFNDGGTGQVLDYSDGSIIGTFTFEPSNQNHANSAQFTNIYYDANDEFPLMLLSRCGNSSGGDASAEECLVYRIQRSGTTFTFTLVNTIDVDFTTYGSSWGIDNNADSLYCVTFTNGTWQTSANNPVKYYVFKMPTKTEILSGTPIELSDSDKIGYMEIEHNIPQGLCVNGGVIYNGFSYRPTPTSDIVPSIWAIDIWKNRILSKIRVGDTAFEIEGIAIYDGKLYASQKKGSDTAGTNPLKIKEITFE